MPTLVLMRHTKAGTGVRDFDRPLRAEGRQQAAWVGSILAARMNGADLAIVSAAKRAQETFEGLKSGGLTFRQAWIEDFMYDASWDELTVALRDIPREVRSVVVVGHEPTMSATTELLSDGTYQLPQGFPAGTCAIGTVEDWAYVGSHSLHITDVLTPPM
jgi:phosphohistidine phosphatase